MKRARVVPLPRFETRESRDAALRAQSDGGIHGHSARAMKGVDAGVVDNSPAAVAARLRAADAKKAAAARKAATAAKRTKKKEDAKRRMQKLGLQERLRLMKPMKQTPAESRN